MTEVVTPTVDLTKSQQSSQQPVQQSAQSEPIKEAQIQQQTRPSTQPERKNTINQTNSKETNELAEAISKFEEQLRQLTKAQNFIEAEGLKNKIKELRLEMVIRKSKEIEYRHAEELERLISNQSVEIEKFNQSWDVKIGEFKEEVHIAEQEMLIKHEKDLGMLENDLKESLPVFVRTSPQIANIKKMIETLAKQKEFVQADKLRGQLALLEGEELRKSEEQKEKKLNFILLQLVTKQKSEFNGLKKRITTAYSELIKAKDIEYQKLLCKLQNLRKTLDTAQQLEFSKFEMMYKNFVPGERLQFKSRQRREAGTMQSSTRTGTNSSLNASFGEPSKTTSPIPVIDPYKRSVTPIKRGQIRGHSSNHTSGPRQNTLIPINNGRFGTPQKERK